MSYPYMPWDNEDMRSLRQLIQKPFESEEFLAWILYRRISIYVSRILAVWCFITPNMITTLAIAAILLSMAVAFMWPSTTPLLIAIGLTQFAYFLDLVDGEVARIRKQFSQFGVLLDAVLADLYAISAAYILLLVSNVLGLRELWVLWALSYHFRVAVAKWARFSSSRANEGVVQMRKGGFGVLASFVSSPGFVLIFTLLGLLLHPLLLALAMLLSTLVCLVGSLWLLRETYIDLGARHS